MRTYNVRLEFESGENHNRLMDTFRIHQTIWNHLSEYIFKKCISGKQDLSNSKNKNSKRFKLFSALELHHKTYYKCRKLFPQAPSQIVIRAREDVVSTFKAMRSNNVLDGIASYPIKKKLSIRLDSRIYTMKGNTIKITTNGKRIICRFTPYPKLQELMERYPMCDPLIFERKGEIWLAITFDDTAIPLPNNYCIGVDLGIRRTIATSEGLMISDKIYLKQRRKARYLKRCLQAAKKENVHQGRKGSSARRHLAKIKHYEKNLSRDYIHNVVNSVLNNKANTIVIEDLSGMKKDTKGKKTTRFNNRNSQVPYYMFKEISSYKAQALGKRVETVNPAYTSQDDYRNLERGTRAGCRYHASDGKVFDADIQGSINIGNRWGAKNKLPVSFVFPSDGKYKLYRQGAVNHPSIQFPSDRKLETFCACDITSPRSLVVGS